jgi:hypothetical protein
MSNGDSETEGRLCVLEEAKKLHGTEINRLWGEVSEIKSCVYDIPSMKRTLEKMDEKMDQIVLSNASNTGLFDGKWGERVWSIFISILAAAVFILGASYLHIFKVG